MMTSAIILQAAGGAGSMNVIIILLFVVVFYFFMIRPQQKKQKEINKFRSELKTGDKVITAGGVYGKIKDINDNVVTLEIADNVKIRIDKSSIYASAADSQQPAK